MVFLTFFGEARSDEARRAHESPAVMWIPLAILAVGAAAAGWLNLTPEGRLGTFLEPVVGAVPSGEGLSAAALATIAIAVALSALVATWWIYVSGRVDAGTFRARLEPLPTAARNGWYIDRAYDLVVIQPAKALAGVVATTVDARGIDGLVNAVGAGVRRLADRGRLIQTGFVRRYAAVLFGGAIVVLVYVGSRL